MRPVNLLPASERPRAASATPNNGSMMVLGALAVLLAITAVFVVSRNQATSKESAILQAQQEKTAADQQASRYQAYGDFRQIKQTRVDTVTQLAGKRFDWERLMRELALLVPDKVWLSSVSADTAADASGSSTAAPSSGTSAATPSSGAPAAGATADSSSAAGDPTVRIDGCAPSQGRVAETIVRLRSLHGANDVTLQSSQKSTGAGSSTGGAPPASSDSASGGGADCGSGYTFQATVTFKDAAPTTPKRVSVPSRLGGGA